jgi:hypothetical protein
MMYSGYTALPVYHPKFSNPKAHLGLWCCNQEFLFKSEDEFVWLLVGFGLNLSNSLIATRIVKL